MITNQIKIKLVVVSLVLGAIVLISLNAGGGILEPNAPPSPTMHTLEDIYNVASAGVEPPPQPFAFDGFLKIDGIQGESTDPCHLEWIEIISYSHGISQSEGFERADHQDFSIVKTLDKASPKLFLYSCTGDPIAYVQLELCEPTDAKKKFMEYKIENVTVSSIDTYVQGGDPLPMEEVSFNYGQITWEYTMTDGNSIFTGWDLDTNSPITPSD